MENYFGSKITREIWSRLDVILLIYVGSAADFPLASENHWLFFTNKLPENPQKRFVDTFMYNQKLFFTPKEHLPEILKNIKNIHKKVELERNPDGEMKISNKAFLEVFFMLTDYAIRGYEYLQRRKLSIDEKNNYIQDINQIAQLMEIKDFPNTFEEFSEMRQISINNNLKKNAYTDKLYQSYLADLGSFRYWILLSFQREFIPRELSLKLNLKRSYIFALLYKVYPYIHHSFLLKIIIKFLLKPETEKALYRFQQA